MRAIAIQLCTVTTLACLWASVAYAQDNTATPTNAASLKETKPKKQSAASTKKESTTNTTPPPVMTPVAEFSDEQKLLIENASKLDTLNKELLVRNQQLQITNEKISLQVEMLKHDRYSEGTRDTLVSIFLGILIGWFFTRSNKRSRYRDF